MKQAKINHYADVFSRISNDPRKIWDEVRDLLGHKPRSNVTSIETEAGVLSDENAATAFNKYFVTCCDTQDDNNSEVLHLLSNSYSIPNTTVLTPVTCTEVE